jgi:predicted dehydrogenase
MVPAKRHRVGIIGLGMAVGPHARSLLDLADRVEVAGGYSRSAERRAGFAGRYGFPVVDRLEALTDDPTIDAVLLLTPPDAREEIVERLASTGKHILMEKPVERTTEAASRIVERCEQAGVTLGIVFQQRFREGSLALARLMRERALGDPAFIHAAIPWWRPQAYYDEPGRGTLARDGGGVLLCQAIHTLDLLLSLTGPVAEVAAIAGTTAMHRMETEDSVGAGLRFANGALGALMATTAQYPGHPETIAITGTKGSAVLSRGELVLRYQDGREQRLGEPAPSGGGADPMAFPHDWHRAVIVDFLDAIEEGRPPRVSGRDGLRVHRLIDALLASSRSGRRVRVAG